MDVFCRRDGFLGFRTDSTIVDNGPAGNRVFPVVDEDGRVDEIAIFIIVPNPEFCDLASNSHSSEKSIRSAVGSGIAHTTERIPAWNLGFCVFSHSRSTQREMKIARFRGNLGDHKQNRLFIIISL